MAKKQRSAKTSVAIGSTSTDKSPDTSIKVPQRDKIDFPLNIRQREDLTERQKGLIDLILDRDTKVVFLFGPAGTSKTYVSVLAGLQLLAKHSISDIVYIRSAIESASRSLGFLPGEQGDKMAPSGSPMVDKLEELLSASDVNALTKDKRVESIPINYLRGASFNARFIILDEAQNCDFKELTTVLTRVGKFSKLIVSADPDQSDINGRSGATKMFDLFNDEESRKQGIHCFSFTKDDIVRSGIVAYIVGRIESQKSAAVKSEPMFPTKTCSFSV